MVLLCRFVFSLAFYRAYVLLTLQIRIDTIANITLHCRHFHVLVNDSVFFVRGVTQFYLCVSIKEQMYQQIESFEKVHVAHNALCKYFFNKNEWVAITILIRTMNRYYIFFNFIHVKIPLLTPHRIISCAH